MGLFSDFVRSAVAVLRFEEKLFEGPRTERIGTGPCYTRGTIYG